MGFLMRTTDAKNDSYPLGNAQKNDGTSPLIIYEWRTKLLTTLLAMDMAKVGGPVSVVNVCTSMRCAKIGYRQVGGPLSVVKVFTQL